MAHVLKIECSHCSAMLKLKDQAKLGKTVRCPKCRNKFVVDLAPTDTHSETNSEIVDDGGFYDEVESDWDDSIPENWEDDFDQKVRPKKRKRTPDARSGKRKGKRSKQKRGKPSKAAFLILSGGLLLLVLAVAGIIFAVQLLAGGNSVADRLKWLPADTETYVEIRFADVWKAPAMKPLRESEFGLEMKEELAKYGDLKVEDIERVVFGIPANSAEVGYRIHLKNPIDTSKLDPEIRQETYAGKTIYTDPKTQQALFLLNERTIVGGSKENLHAAIDRQGATTASDRFSTIPDNGQVLFATSSPAGMISAPGVRILGESEIDQSEVVSAYGSVSIGTNLNIDFAIQFQEQQGAEVAVEDAKQGLKEFKDEMAMQLLRLENEAFLPSRQQRATAMKMQHLADSINISRRGNEMRVSLQISGYIFDEFAGIFDASYYSPFGGLFGRPF